MTASPQSAREPEWTEAQRSIANVAMQELGACWKDYQEVADMVDMGQRIEETACRALACVAPTFVLSAPETDAAGGPLRAAIESALRSELVRAHAGESAALARCELLQAALEHRCYREHEHSDGCDGCARIDAALAKDGGTT